jgi:hypothetical protein
MKVVFSVIGFAALIGGSLAASAGQVLAEEPPQPSLTVEEIYRAASAAQAELRTARVEYDLRRTYLQKLQSFTNTRPIEYPSRIIFVYLGDERRYLDEFSPMFGSPPYDRRLAYFNGEVTLRYLGGTLNIKEGKDTKECEANECYCRDFLHIALSDRERAKRDNSLQYPHRLRTVPGLSNYRLLSHLEKEADTWCHVLELPYTDKIWVDVDKGCAVVRRETYTGSKKDKVLLVSHKATDFIQATDRLWIPLKCRLEYYPGLTNPPSTWNKPYYRYDINVIKANINKATEDDLKLDIPEGTIVNDRNLKSFRLDGSNVELLSHYAKLSRPSRR